MFWKNKKFNVGAFGEKEAKKFLKKKGFKILDLNFQNKKGRKVGEIDIVARKNGEIVFVEVKARRSIGKNILPEENITHKKLSNLQRIAQVYLKEKKLTEKPYHFDAVSVLISPEKKVVEIRHMENIFI